MFNVQAVNAIFEYYKIYSYFLTQQHKISFRYLRTAYWLETMSIFVNSLLMLIINSLRFLLETNTFVSSANNKNISIDEELCKSLI